MPTFEGDLARGFLGVSICLSGVLVTPNELFWTLFVELIFVPLAWSQSELDIGDTPISVLLRVFVLGAVMYAVSYWVVEALIVKPLYRLWCMIRRKEYYDYLYEDNGETLALAALVSMTVWLVAANSLRL